MRNQGGGVGMALRVKAISLAVASCFSVAVPHAYGNPQGFAVVNGQASFNYNGRTLSVINTPGAIINWQSFSIGAAELTRFIQQSGSSSVLNRVIGVDPSLILGALQSNGRVFLLNPNGIMFGAGAQIDVAGLVASTLNMSDGDFLAGRMRFTAVPGAGGIVNQGSITTPSGGQIYLIAPNVQNSGIITSPQGEIILAAGRSVELVDAGTPGLRVELTAPDSEAVNVGQIVADSGKVGIYAGLIRNSGVILADGVVAGQNGEILLKATHHATLDAGGSLSASGAQGGTVTMQAGNTTLVSGTVEARGSAGQGGTVKVLGNAVGLLDQAVVDASGQAGGGTVLVGGDYQGKNPSLQNAQVTYFGPQARINADAIQNGAGGYVILWADNATRAYGTISARGGAQSGNGGFVETSGHYLDVTRAPDLSAPAGRSGAWLIDPTDVRLVRGSTDVNITSAPSFAPVSNNSPSQISDSTINSAINSGTSVTLSTGGSPGTGGSGDILIDSGFSGPVSIDKTTNTFSTTLRLDAWRDIRFMGGTTTLQTTAAAGAQTLTVQLNPGQSGAGAIFTDPGAAVTLRGAGGALLAQVMNGKNWQNDGAINLQAGSAIRLFDGTSFASLHNNGTLNINTGGFPIFSNAASQSGVFDNGGTVNVNTSSSFEAAFSNAAAGVLNVNGAGTTLSMQNGQTIAGTVGINDPTATLWVSEIHGTPASFSGTTIAGNGSLLVQGSGFSPVANFSNLTGGGVTLRVGPLGTANINGTTTFGGLAMSGGTLGGGGDFFVTNSFSQTGGTFSTTGNLSITQASGNLTVPSITNTGSRDIELTATSGNLAVGTVNAGRYALLRATAGAITDTNGAAANVTATHLEAAAANGIDLDTSLSGGSPSYLNATNSTSGNIMLRNTGGGATIQNIANAGGSNILTGLLSDSLSATSTGGAVIHGQWISSAGQSTTSPANPRFAFTTSGGARIILNSPRANTFQSDPVVILLDASGAVIQRDDDSGQAFVAMINRPTLPAGTYVVVAATFSAGQSTPFDLSIAGPVTLVGLPAPLPGPVASQLARMVQPDDSSIVLALSQNIAAFDRSTDFAQPAAKGKSDKQDERKDASKPPLCK